MADDAIQDIKFLPRDESPEQEAQNIIERRRWSEQYTADLWDELKEVYRGIKCRVEKKKKKNPANSDEMIDDNTSTNVAMPDLNIMHRRNTARLTAQPYRLRYIGGSQPYLAETLSAQASMQYDRSKEAVQDRRLVMYGEAFGFAYSKLFYDDLGFDMNVQRAIMKNNEIVIRDRAAIMRAAGAPPDEIRQAVKEKGRQVSDAEVAEFMGRTGNFIQMQKKVQRYAGPCVKAVFPGDLALQPGCLSVYESDYAIESYQETDLWLKKQTNLTYIHPETGKETYAFDRDAIQRLIDLDPEPDQSRLTLKNLFEEVSDKANRPLWKSLRIRRRYDMLEEHSQDDNGIMWIKWASFHMRDKVLGKMPYPADFYGAYAYSEMVPLPDMVSAFGDSTPRLLRFLYQLHNRVVAQNFDYISNTLKKFLLVKEGKRIQEPVDRGLFREIRCEDISEAGIRFLQEPPLPVGAFEREAQVMRMMGIAEPSLNNVDTGSSANPQAGKTATTAVLASKAADALTMFKIDGRNLYLRDLGQKKLWMNQQLQDPDQHWTIDEKFWGGDLTKMVKEGQVPTMALSSRNGKTTAIRLDPMEIQEDFEVEPEVGSYLAVDDEIRQAAAMDLESAAAANPDIADRRKIFRFHLTTVRGIGNPDDYILPEQPPDPMAGIKVGVNVSVPTPFDELPAPAKVAILKRIGLDPQVVAQVAAEFQADDSMKGVTKLGQAANAAADMTSPADQIEEQGEAPAPAPNRKPRKKKR
jgi:hypothetical protein